jgi:hypothetical protein
MFASCPAYEWSKIVLGDGFLRLDEEISWDKRKID